MNHYLGPHQLTSNGYFGRGLPSSSRCGSSTRLPQRARRVLPRGRAVGEASDSSRRCLAFLAASSFIAILASVKVVFGDDMAPKPAARWMAIVAMLSTRDAVMTLTCGTSSSTRRFLYICLTLLWGSAVWLTTIRGNSSLQAPFMVAGNGFFSVWFSFFASLYLAVEELDHALAASSHFHAANLYWSAGLLLALESAQYLGHFEPSSA